MCQGVSARVDRLRMASEHIQKLHERVRRLLVVVYDKYASRHALRASMRARLGRETEYIGDRELDHEFTSFATPVAPGPDSAGMQFDNFLHERESDAEPARVTAVAPLIIDFKNIGKVIGVDAFAVVAYFDDRPFFLVCALLREVDPDGAARRCEFRGIVHKVGDGLFEPRIVRPHGQQRRRVGEVERDVRCAQKSIACFERTLDEPAELERVRHNLDFCLREARDVEQIAEELREVVELVFDIIKFLAHVGRGLAQLQELKRALNRGEGIAQFVRKRCKEKVLCLVAFVYFFINTAVVENDAEVVAEFPEEFEVVPRVHAARLRVSERQCAERITERANRNNHERFQAQALHRLQMLGGARAQPYRLVGNDGYELRLARADGRVEVARVFFGRGKTLLELKEVVGHLLVAVNDRDTFEAALLIEHMNRAPVGEGGHRQIGLFQEPGAKIDFHRKNLCRFQHETEFVFAGCDARHTGDVERNYVHVFIWVAVYLTNHEGQMKM